MIRPHPAPFRRPTAAAAGFTLVEILVALGVFALGITGVIALFGTATFTAQQAFDTTEAEVLLDSVCAELEMIPDRYRPENLLEDGGRPQELLRVNGGTITPPDGGRNAIILPANWPGAIESRTPADPDRGTAGRLSYDIVFTPLTWTIDLATGQPQCSLATITIYWDRIGRSITLERRMVVRWVR